MLHSESKLVPISTVIFVLRLLLKLVEALLQRFDHHRGERLREISEFFFHVNSVIVDVKSDDLVAKHLPTSLLDLGPHFSSYTHDVWKWSVQIVEH